MNQQKDPAALSLRQQFASATMAVGAGMAAAFGVHETITPLFDYIANAPVFSFLATYGALFAVTGGTMGYIDESFRQANAEHHRRGPWGHKPGLWR